MKKTYETPSIEVVKFQYRDQVVVASSCIVTKETGVIEDHCYGGSVKTKE